MLLGATGSIGASTLRVITAQSDRLELVGIAAHGKYAELATIARQFGVRHVGLYDSAAHSAACRSADFPAGTKFYGGASGLSELATLPEADIILIAVVGTAGLQPALAAIAEPAAPAPIRSSDHQQIIVTADPLGRSESSLSRPASVLQREEILRAGTQTIGQAV